MHENVLAFSFRQIFCYPACSIIRTLLNFFAWTLRDSCRSADVGSSLVALLLLEISLVMNGLYFFVLNTKNMSLNSLCNADGPCVR